MEPTTTRINVPQDVSEMLLADERVQLAVKQSRWKVLFTPDTIFFTNHRIIRYSPSGFLGFRKDIEDYRYEDIANFKVSNGLLFATVTIGRRFMSESLVLDNLPKGRTGDISKAVQENIGKSRDNGTSGPVLLAKSQEAQEVLRLRFARGEITKEQFEEMKRTLG